MSKFIIETYTDPQTDSTIFLKIDGDVVWERYGLKFPETVLLINVVAELIRNLDKYFIFVPKEVE